MGDMPVHAGLPRGSRMPSRLLENFSANVDAALKDQALAQGTLIEI